MAEMVDHPAHYGGGDNPYEVIKVLGAWGLLDDFCIGNAIKYLARAGKKGPTLQDYKKARWYLDFKIARLESAPSRAPRRRDSGTQSAGRRVRGR